LRASIKSRAENNNNFKYLNLDLIMKSKFQIFEGVPCYFKYKSVGWGMYKTGENDEIIGTDHVSACLAFTLYYPKTKKGALAHITGFPMGEIEDDYLRPEEITDILLSELKINKNQYSSLEATLAGETEELKLFSPIVRAKLQEKSIPIIGEDIGEASGCFGRAVFLRCNTGNVKVYRKTWED